MITFLFTALVCSLALFLLLILCGILAHISVYGIRTAVQLPAGLVDLLLSFQVARSDRLPNSLAVIFDNENYSGVSRSSVIPGINYPSVYLIHARSADKEYYITVLPFTEAARILDLLFMDIPLFSQWKEKYINRIVSENINQ